MDLYNFHSKPEKLHGHFEANNVVPSRIFNKVTRTSKETKKEKEALARNPQIAYEYARKKDRAFPEGEDAIAKNTDLAAKYAHYVTQKPFPKGEDAIAKSAMWSYYYAKDNLESPFPKGENAILNVEKFDDNYIIEYALYVLKKRWSAGEKVLLSLKDPLDCRKYAEFVIKGPWPEAEDIIAINGQQALIYAQTILFGRFPKGEKEIKKLPNGSGEYFLLTGIKL